MRRDEQNREQNSRRGNGGSGQGRAGDPYRNDGYGNNGYGSNGYGNNPYGNDPYGNNGYGNNPYGSNPQGSSRYGTSYSNGGPYYGNGGQPPYRGEGTQQPRRPYQGAPQDGRNGYYTGNGGGRPQGSYDNGGSGKKGGGRRKKKKTTFGDVLSSFLMIIALCVFLFSGYTLYGYYKEYKKSADEYDNLEESYAVGDPEETEDYDALESTEAAPEKETEIIEENGELKTVPVMTSPVDFTELKKVNEDIVGWLKIRALDISYPVVQGEDNDYYLHRTFEKVDNFAGCIFINSDNASDLTDQNTIVYGHNMKDGSMFGKLKKFQEDEVWDTSEYFWIFTPDIIYQYHIFSAMTVNKTGMTYQTFFTKEEFQSLINTAFEQSVVDNSHITVEEDDRIVTLSTCTGNDATRFVVMGKLEQIYAVRK